MAVRIDGGSRGSLRQPGNEAGTYRVKAGDTLSEIALAVGCSLAELLKLNPQIKNADLIRIGERLRLPGGAQGTSSSPSANATPKARPNARPNATPNTTPSAAAASAKASPPAGGSASSARTATAAASPIDSSGDNVLEGPGARPLASGAAPAAAAPAPPRGAVDRLVAAAQREATRLLLDEQTLDKDIPLGSFGKGTVRITNSAVDEGFDLSRMRYAEDAERQGKQAVFVQTEGALGLEASRTVTRSGDGSGSSDAGGSVSVRAGASASFSLVRGHMIDKHAPDPLALGRDLVKASTVELPLSQEKARAMEPGSSLTLRYAADAGLDAKRAGARVKAAARGDIEVNARFLGDQQAEVRVSRRGGRDGSARIERDDGARRLSGRAEASDNRDEISNYTLDLRQPGAQKVYERLLRGDTKAADAAAKGDDTGVVRDFHGGRKVKERLVEGRVRTGSADEQQRQLEVGGAASTRTTVDLESGTRTLRKTLGAQLALTTPLKDGTVLGLAADGERLSELTLPGGAKADDVALPLDAAAAQALPPGARFELRGRGTIGASVGMTRGETDAGATDAVASRLVRRGDVEIAVAREEGARVDVEVTVRSTVQKDVDASQSRRRNVSVGLSAADKRTTIREETASLSLDLDVPAHRAAYDAALRGDLGPAHALGAGVVEAKDLWSRDRRLGVDLSVPLGSGQDAAQLKGDWRREILSADDSRITFDDDRSALVAAAREKGEELRWVDHSTTFAPGARASFGSVAKIGFDASAKLEARALLPEGHASQAVPNVPLTARDALALPRGAEVTLEGRAKVSALWGMTWGADVEAALARASASVSVAHEQIVVDRAVEVTAKRLDGNKVEMRLDDAKGTGRKTGLEARVGVDTNLEAVPGASALKDIPLGGTLLDRAEKTLDDKLAASFVAEGGKRQSSSKGINVVLDLSSPAGRSAYEAFMRGDAEPALALARKTSGDAARVESRRETRRVETSSSTRLTVAGDALFLREALRADSTVIETVGSRTTTTDVSTYLKKHEALIGRKGELKVEAVRVRTDDAPEGRGYFHVSVSGSDSLTSKREMKELVSLGESLGAAPVRPIRVEADDKRGIRKILGSAARHGSTQTELALFVTQKGIDELRKKSGADGARAYARFLERVEGQPPPWIGPKAQEARELITFWESNNHDQAATSNAHSEYWQKFKRNIYEDSETFQTARAISRAVDGMKASSDPAQWNRTFADLGQEVDFDITGAVAAINELVGKDELLVHRFSVKGRAVDVEMKDEGFLDLNDARPA